MPVFCLVMLPLPHSTQHSSAQRPDFQRITDKTRHSELLSYHTATTPKNTVPASSQKMYYVFYILLTWGLFLFGVVCPPERNGLLHPSLGGLARFGSELEKIVA
jgi:hypothetical protein